MTLPEARHAGRPRDPRLDEAVLSAALEVFMKRGYRKASLIEVARKAGVGTPAIYRRWRTKADLAIDLIEREAQPEPIPHSRSIRRDLAEFVRGRVRMFSTPLFHQVLLPVTADAAGEPRLARQIRQRFNEYRQPAVEARVRKAVEGGELRRDTDPARLINLLMGTITMPLLFSQDLPKESEAQKIVDQVLQGFAARR